MIEMMLKRRSIRKFTSEPVSAENKEKLIKAALSAPSSMGKNPVELIVTEDRDIIAKIKTCKNFGTTALEEATLVMVVIADAALSDVWVEDASIVATYLTLEAEHLGLGLNWIQMRNRTSGSEPSEVAIRNALGIPEKYGVLAVMAIGNKNEEKPGYGEDRLNMAKVHTDKF